MANPIKYYLGSQARFEPYIPPWRTGLYGPTGKVENSSFRGHPRRLQKRDQHKKFLHQEAPDQ